MKVEYRKEYKRILNHHELNNFFIKYSSDLNEIYEPRTIKSLYFDTIDFSLFKSSLFNDASSIKLRIRTYSNSKKFFKEIKTNNFAGKFKSINELSINSFNEVEKIFLKNKTLYPLLYTEYKRRYFSFKECRVTLDTNISFLPHEYRGNSYSVKHYHNNIVEYKALGNNYDIEKYIDINPVAFSKFKSGVQKIYGY